MTIVLSLLGDKGLKGRLMCIKGEETDDSLFLLRNGIYNQGKRTRIKRMQTVETSVLAIDRHDKMTK